LKRAYKAGVRNIEMESTVFAAMCGLCGLKGKLFLNTEHSVLLFHKTVYSSEKEESQLYTALG
jgi:uridine phosphorylase